MEIPLSHEKSSFPSEANAPTFRVDGIMYRKLIELVKTANLDAIASRYHYNPHKIFCRHSTQTPSPATSSEHFEPLASFSTNKPLVEFEETQLYDETYNSDTAIEKEEQLLSQEQNPEDSSDLLYKVTAIYISSNSMKVA